MTINSTPNLVDNSNQEELGIMDYNMTCELTRDKNIWKDLLKEKMILSKLTKLKKKETIHCPSLRIFLKYYVCKDTCICIPFKNTCSQKSKRK